MWGRGKIKKVIILSLIFVHFQLTADEHIPGSSQIDVNISQETLATDFISYPAGFFARFSPVTAADMVKQVPGFQLDNNDSDRVRGFSEAAGNILIDDRRPSTKQDSLINILSRIPASSVERIELIRRQVRGVDLRGQSTVVNLILREGIPAAIQWETTLAQTFEFGPPTPQANISLSDTWSGIEFNTGLRGSLLRGGRSGIEDVFDNTGNLAESRIDERRDQHELLIANINTAAWLGETFVQLNSNYKYDRRHLLTDSPRHDEQMNLRRTVIIDNDENGSTYEIGLDFERSLLPDLLAKGIFMHVGGKDELGDIQISTNSSGIRTLYRKAVNHIDTTESIGRLEFDWSALSDHLVQFNLELASNTLDSTLQQTDDTGTGPVNIVVPGANSRVEEIRWDFQLKDTWVAGQFKLEYGLGAEASTITQTGDAEQERDFFFLKPQTVLSYSPNNSDQTRLRLAREISQLDLGDFVSGTQFVDDYIILGNPNIRPDTTWKLELSQEKRFDSDAAVKLTAYHNWISDVLDWLPITPTFAAPGNIGDGRRWGVLWENTLPLDWAGLASAKLDIKLRWQDSIVLDPVTGEKRKLSFSGIYAGPVFFNVENEYGIEIDYRQDFQASQIAWGWHIGERAVQLLYKVNELERYNEGMEFNTFIETTRWFGIKSRLSAENLLDFADTRDRTIFTGERDLSPLATRHFRDRIRGRRLLLSFSGNF